MFLWVKSYTCVEFGPMRTHKEVFDGLLELRTQMDSGSAIPKARQKLPYVSA